MNGSKTLSEFFRWFIFVSYCLFLYVAYTLPIERLPRLILGANDKVLHFLNFFILTLLGFRTFSSSRFPFWVSQSERKAVSFALFYGAITEWAQQGIPGRETSFYDWLADAAGAFAVWGIFRLKISGRPSS